MSKTMSSNILWQPNGIMGLSFVADFDTSQSMYIGDFWKNVFDGKMAAKCVDVPVKSIYKEMIVPGLIIYNKEHYGKNAENLSIERIVENEYYLFPNGEDGELSDLNRYSEYSNICQSIELNGTNFFTIKDKSIFSFVIGGDLMLFIANPDVPLFLEEELKTKKDFKDFIRFFRSNEKTRKSYLGAIGKRRKLFFEKLKGFFSSFVASSIENGFSCQSLNQLFSSEDYILVGKKEDSIVWREERLCPYYRKEDIDDTIKQIGAFDFYERYTREELDVIAAEKREYNRKKDIVINRMSCLEKLLKEKNFSWTIISKREPKFEENPYEYRVWMNAQASDDANHMWCTEKDFIDWFNLEGKIPFYRAIVSYYSKMLESLSNEEYKFIEYRKKDKKEKTNYYSNYESIGVFKKGKSNTILTIEEIKEKIVSINGFIPKYTMEDFEKALFDFYKGDETLYKF